MKKTFHLIIFSILSCFALNAVAQTRIMQFPGERPEVEITLDSTIIDLNDSTQQENIIVDSIVIDSAAIARKASGIDSVLLKLRQELESPDFYKIEVDTTIKPVLIPRYFFRPAVFCGYTPNLEKDTIAMVPSCGEDTKYYNWLSREVALNNRMESIKLCYIINNPDKVKYNLKTLPKAPKHFKSIIDPRKSKLTIINQGKDNVADELDELEVERINWIRSFDGAIQFSQAYVSPNWYQGGNNNLNMLINSEYNVKLNEAFYPHLLFETNFKYKLVMNSTPEDEIRSYNISDDIFQINSKFGLKAAKHWYYSVQAQLKTQLFNSYKPNSWDLKSSFMSPGELNVGLGMTYNFVNSKKTVTFDASVSPLSYNLITCISSRMDETSFGIKEGRKAINQYGSSGEGKLKWNISSNISLASRLFVFTNYEYIQGDLENTLAFTINRFLSTQINLHLRYDSSAQQIEGSKWNKLQLKEILSFGFAYKLKNI